MRITLLALILFFLLCLISCGSAERVTVYENTSRSGPVYSDERWRGVIDITGDVTIYSGTVSIEAGTTVRFAAGSDDRGEGSSTPISDPYYPHDPAIAPSQICSLAVFGGNLYAEGTSGSQITFTSSAASQEEGDWDSIQYNQSGSRLVLQNVVIEYGYFGVQINAAADDSQIVLRDNTLRKIVASGITCGSNSSLAVSVTVSGNDISSCGHEGVATYLNKNLTIESNVFHDIWNYVDGPSGAGVVIESNDSTVRNNQFLRNRVGILITGECSPVISGNTFTDNGTDQVP